MLKNVGGILVIIAILFGWQQTHDRKVRAEVIASARRDSLLYSAKIVKVKDDSIVSLKSELEKKGKEIGKKIVKVEQEKKDVETKGSSDSTQIASLKLLVNIERDKNKDVRGSLVDSLTKAYDDRLGNLQTQVFIQSKLTQLAKDSTKLMTDLYDFEVQRRVALEGLNAGLVKELGAVKPGMSLGKALVTHIIPAAAITFIVEELRHNERVKSERGNETIPVGSEDRGTEFIIPLK